MRGKIVFGFLLTCGCSQPAGLEQAAQEASEGLSVRDQCSAEDVEFWDSRQQACTGPWTYHTYDCFKEDSTSACGQAGYAQKPVIGTLSCEHPDNGATRWTLATTQQRTVTYRQLAGYESFLMKEAERMFGREAIGVYRITHGNIGELPRWLSRLGNHDRPIPYTEVYYHQVAPNEWERQASYDFTMPLRDMLLKQHHIMGNAKANLAEGFGVGTWADDARPMMIYTPNAASPSFTVEESFFKAVHFAIKTHPACGEGVLRYETDVNEPLYERCRHISHGREPENCCEAPEQEQSTAPNLTLAELPQEHAYALPRAVCSTGDALIYATDSDRLDALYAVSGGRSGATGLPLPESLTTSHIKGIAVKRAKFLYERHSAPLPDTAVLQAKEVYARSVGLHACGTSGARSDSDSVSLGRVDQCHRLSLDHVSASATERGIRACLPQAASLSEMHPTAQAFYRGQLIQISHSMLDKYIRTALAENVALCNDAAADAAELVDAWFEAAQDPAEIDRITAQRDALVASLAEQCLEVLP